MSGKPFFNFSLINPQGETKQISDYVYKSNLLFLDFWASWCGPCLAQEPQIIKLYQEYKKNGFEILGISLDVNRENWQMALKKKEAIRWPELCVADKKQSEELRLILEQITKLYE